MGISNRDYYRDSDAGARRSGLEGMPSVIKFLILANVIVFLLQIFITREVRLSPLEAMRKFNPTLDRMLTEKEEEGEEPLETLRKNHPKLYQQLSEREADSILFPGQKVSVVQEWFELDSRKVVYQGQVWRLLTHAFCHDRLSLLHLVFNMLLLYWFGCTLEVMYGSREFLLFYLTAAVVAGLTFVALDLYTGSRAPAIGASGAVMAVMMLYTWHYPYETLYLFWFFPVQMRWVMLFYLIWDLHPILLALSGERLFTGIAHAAHLGGLVFGFCYGYYQWRLEPLLDRLPHLRWQRRPRLRVYRAPEPEPQPVPAAADFEMDRLDAILEKISLSGQASLTAEELALLRNASERLKARRKQ